MKTGLPAGLDLPERLAYTNRLFDLLAELTPEGVDGSVSTVPVSFKQFKLGDRGLRVAGENLWRCVDHQEQLARRTENDSHLGLEPEPFGTVENSTEFLTLFEQLEETVRGTSGSENISGSNYDTCHFAPAVRDARQSHRSTETARGQGEQAAPQQCAPRASHLGSACPLQSFVDNVYFHQVIERRADGELIRYLDLDEAGHS